MPVRKIKKNYRSVTGYFASVKNGRNIAYESLLERDFFLLLEFDRLVSSYEEQPLRLSYRYGNKDLPYTPDALVQYKAETLPPCIFEIKYSDEIKEKKVFLREKFVQIEDYLRSNDMEFKLFTELDIRTQFLENAKMIYRFASINDMYYDERINKISDILETGESMSVTECMNRLSQNRYDQAIHLPYLWHLIFTGKISIDMDSKITNNSLIGIEK